ncbi:hypothetical protein GCM10009589_36880 [Arthrobacter pascens]
MAAWTVDLVMAQISRTSSLASGPIEGTACGAVVPALRIVVAAVMIRSFGLKWIDGTPWNARHDVGRELRGGAVPVLLREP